MNYLAKKWTKYFAVWRSFSIYILWGFSLGKFNINFSSNISSSNSVLYYTLFLLFCSYCFLMIFIFFIIVGLQCPVNFYYTGKWPSFSHTHTHTHIYTHILFLTSSSIMFHHKWLDIVPCAIYSRISLLFF